MRIIKFKRPDDTIYCGGQVIHQGNINPDKYDELMKISPAFGDHFEVIDQEEKKDKPKAEKP